MTGIILFLGVCGILAVLGLGARVALDTEARLRPRALSAEPARPRAAKKSVLEVLRTTQSFVRRPHVGPTRVTWAFERREQIVEGTLRGGSAGHEISLSIAVASADGALLPDELDPVLELVQTTGELSGAATAILQDVEPDGEVLSLSWTSTESAETVVDDIDRHADALAIVAQAVVEAGLARRGPAMQPQGVSQTPRVVRERPVAFVRPDLPPVADPLGFLPDADPGITFDELRLRDPADDTWMRLTLTESHLQARYPHRGVQRVALDEPLSVSLSHSWTAGATALLHVEVRQRATEGVGWVRIPLSCHASDDPLEGQVHGLPELSRTAPYLEPGVMLALLARLRASMQQTGTGQARWGT